jgi:hypothetical protein
MRIMIRWGGVRLPTARLGGGSVLVGVVPVGAGHR